MHLSSITHPEFNLLTRLFLAFLIAEFVLQPQWMKTNKNIFAKGIIVHTLINLSVTGMLCGNWILAVIIAGIHYTIDIVRHFAAIKSKKNLLIQFGIAQFSYVTAIIVVWCIYISKPIIPILNLEKIFTDHKISLILTAYIICIWPVGFIVGMATEKIRKKKNLIDLGQNNQDNDELENAGRLIGIFERVIILTFVLFEQYEAIGFLITGKSLLRLNSKKQTEYVLAGTMLSYALAIVTGVLVNYFLKF